MSDTEPNAANPTTQRQPWNKGKLIGPKPPLRPGHVWSIRTKLQLDGSIRDLALFNLAIDSKLRGCDVVAVRVDDVAPNGYTLDRATVPQKKTGRPVRFELTDQTRRAIDEYLHLTQRKPGEFLFAGRGGRGGLTTRQYARLVTEWTASISLDPRKFGTHSLRRTKATLIYRKTGNLRAVQLANAAVENGKEPTASLLRYGAPPGGAGMVTFDTAAWSQVLSGQSFRRRIMRANHLIKCV